MKNAGQNPGKSPDPECGIGDSPGAKTSFSGMLGAMFSYCPYTMAGKKVVRMAKGEPLWVKGKPTNRELYLKSQVKIGYGIMLIGILCPIFWFSYLSGTRGSELMFNAVHSGIVILFGLLFVVYYRLQLRGELS